MDSFGGSVKPNTDIDSLKRELFETRQMLATTKRRLEESELKLSILLENIPGGVLSYDVDTGKFEYISSGVTDIYHCSEEQFRERFYNTFDFMIAKADRDRVKQQINDQLSFFDTVELTYRSEDAFDNLMWIYHRGRVSVDAAGKRKFYVVISDITEEKLVQSQVHMNAERLREKAEMDPMTGLLNKVSMKAAVEECLASSGVGSCHALLMIDTDNFKSVNDTFGHQYGDKIIIFVADSIRKIFRGSDLIGRMGGDEFMVFMKHTTMPITEERAAKLNDAIRTRLSEGGQCVNISCSIGISFYDKDGDSYEALYKAADEALYRSKEGGKDRYTISR